MANIIEVKNLKKSFKNVKAVDDISFNVEEGSFISFLGHNGAGKSTTINMICTMLKPSSGSIFVGGYEVGKYGDAIRNMVGVVFQDSLLDKVLTVEENLRLRACFYDYSEEKTNEVIDYLDDILDIKEILDRRYGKLSGGQRRRVDLAYALVNVPKLLILDEPTTGLDPHTRKMVWESIRRIQSEKGITVFLTTHYMEETLGSDKVIIIDKGKIVAEGTPEELRFKYSSDVLILMPDDENKLSNELEKLNTKYSNDRDTYRIDVKKSEEALHILNNITSYKKFEVIGGNMDDVFLKVTGLTTGGN